MPVRFEDCPQNGLLTLKGRRRRCRCGKCGKCGFPKHSAIHAGTIQHPGLVLGHEFMQEIPKSLTALNTLEGYDAVLREIRDRVHFVLLNGADPSSEEVKMLDSAIMAVVQMRNRKFYLREGK